MGKNGRHRSLKEMFAPLCSFVIQYGPLLFDDLSHNMLVVTDNSQGDQLTQGQWNLLSHVQQ